MHIFRIQNDKSPAGRFVVTNRLDVVDLDPLSEEFKTNCKIVYLVEIRELIGIHFVSPFNKDV